MRKLFFPFITFATIFFTSCNHPDHGPGVGMPTATVDVAPKPESVDSQLVAQVGAKVLLATEDKDDRLKHLGYDNHHSMEITGKEADFCDVIKDLAAGRIENDFCVIAGANGVGISARIDMPNGNCTIKDRKNERDILMFVDRGGVVISYEETRTVLVVDSVTQQQVFKTETLKSCHATDDVMFQRTNYQPGDAEKIFKMVSTAGKEKPKYYAPLKGTLKIT